MSIIRRLRASLYHRGAAVKTVTSHANPETDRKPSRINLWRRDRRRYPLAKDSRGYLGGSIPQGAYVHLATCPAFYAERRFRPAQRLPVDR